MYGFFLSRYLNSSDGETIIEYDNICAMDFVEFEESFRQIHVGE